MSSELSQTESKDESPFSFKLRKKLKNAQEIQEKASLIEQIFNKKMGGDNIWYYLIKWKGNPLPCWEPIDKLQAFKEKLERFEKFTLRKEYRDKMIDEFDDKPIKRIKKMATKEIPSKIEYSEGKLELGDKPKEIILGKMVINEMTNEKDIFCLVEWMPRNNGATPLCSLVNTKDLRKSDPTLLIDFYEKRIVFSSVPITLARTEELYRYYYHRPKQN